MAGGGWRGRVVDEGWTLTAAAEAAGVSVRCARKWVGRYRLEGEPGLCDRSSAPRRVANRTAADRVAAIVKLRRLRFTAAEIAETLGMALSTVSGILTRLGMGRLGRLGLEQPLRYERSRPGELSTSTSRSSAGSRAAPANASTAASAATHSPHAPTRRHAPRHGRLGVRPRRRRRLQPARLRRGARRRESRRPRSASCAAPSPSTAATASRSKRVLTDNGAAYRSTMHALACRSLGIRHLRTRPYRPQTNGKAERFIRTLLNGWAYGAIYRSSTRTHRRP